MTRGRVGHVSVTARGGVLLGHTAVCDGFVFDVPYRVQTHIHLDHMQGFETSKGFQEILMTPATRDLLIAQYDADVPHRCNIHAVSSGQLVELDGVKVTLLPSGHMLGAAQVSVVLADGWRVGYSGDFSWPLPDVVRVDELVVDSTACSSHGYAPSDVEARLVELVVSCLVHGPVALKGRAGTLHRALRVLALELPYPFLVSEEFAREADVYRRHGYPIGALITCDSDLGRAMVSDNERFIHVIGREDGDSQATGETTVVVGARYSHPLEPVVQYSANSFGVAISDHADLNGTLEYVAQTGAVSVVTDSTRGGRASELAAQIRWRLGIPARPSAPPTTRSWGMG